MSTNEYTLFHEVMMALKKKQNRVTGEKWHEVREGLLDEATLEWVPECSWGIYPDLWDLKEQHSWQREQQRQRPPGVSWMLGCCCLLRPSASLPERNIKDLWECQTSLVTANLGISFGLVSDMLSGSLDLLRDLSQWCDRIWLIGLLWGLNEIILMP